MADIPPLREVAGDHALFFDPLDEAAIGAAMRQLAANQVETPGALAHAAGFTWENAAKRTIEVIRSAQYVFELESRTLLCAWRAGFRTS